MLKNKLETFYIAVENARAIVGESPAKIADVILSEAFPNAYEASLAEGCDNMLRQGAIDVIKRYITKPCASERQTSFNDLSPDVMPYVEPLARSSYLVPSMSGADQDEETKTLGFYVPITELVNDPVSLRAARDFMAGKTTHMKVETDKLTALLEYIESQLATS